MQPFEGIDQKVTVYEIWQLKTLESHGVLSDDLCGFVVRLRRIYYLYPRLPHLCLPHHAIPLPYLSAYQLRIHPCQVRSLQNPAKPDNAAQRRQTVALVSGD